MLYGVLGLFALAAAATAFLFLAPPTGLIRDRLVAEVKHRTGRDLTIGGSASLTFFPSLGVSLSDVSLSPPPGMPGAPLITARSLEVQVALMPLITRQVSIERLVLRGPVIDLRVDASGRRSWDFAEAEALRRPWPARFAQAVPLEGRARDQAGRPIPKELTDFARNSGERAARAKTLGALTELSLSDVRISDGVLRYTDLRQGQRFEVDAIDARISLKQFAGPLDVAGTFAKGGERITLEAHAQSFKDALEEQPTKVVIKLNGRPLDLSYDGTLAGGMVTAIDGQLSLKSPSLDALGRFLGLPLTGTETLGAVAVDGQLKVNGSAMALSGANLALGETAAAGRIEIDASAARPRIKANLRFATLDLNRFAGLEAGLAQGAPQAPAAAPGPAGRFAPQPLADAPSARSIEDLLGQDTSGKPQQAPQSQYKSKAPQVRGLAKRSSEGWSSEAMDLSALRLADVEGRFDFDRIAWGTSKIGPAVSGVQLKGGVLKIDVTEVQLYGGKAKGLINIDAREQELAVGANLSGDGLASLPLLRDVAAIESLDGRGRMIAAVSARGGSERELIGTLAGRAELHMTNGAVIGWDAGQMLANLGQGRVPKLDRQPSAKTPFTELSATFQIANGVMRNQDLKFESPSIRSTGSGVVNLVDRNIDMMLKPKQAAAAVGGLSFDVPVRIAGPWDKVAVIPELGNALKTPQAQEAVKKLKEGDVDGALKSALGGGAKADEKISKAKDALKQFLKK